MLHLGIDPGLSGSLAMLRDDGTLTFIRDMPTLRSTKSRREIDGAELRDLLVCWSWREGGMRITIESPGVRPGQHAASGIKTGIGWGRIVGMAEALRISIDIVSPQRWQKTILGDVPKGASKDMARAYAQRTWPDADLGRRKTQDRSDALCIAEYGRRRWGVEVRGAA